MSRVKFVYALLLLFVFNSLSIFAQDVDALSLRRKELRCASHDTSRARILLNIGDCYDAIKPDSALFYYEKALAFIEQSKLINSRNTSISGAMQLHRANALLSIGSIFADRGDYGIAIDYYSKVLQGAEVPTQSEGKQFSFDGIFLLCKCCSYIGNVHLDQGSYDLASRYFNRSLKLYTEMSKLSEKDEARVGLNGISKCYINLGIVALDQGKYVEANGYFFKALKIKEKIGDKRGVSTCYTNIGLVHSFQKSYKNAIAYYNLSLAIDESLGDKKGMSTCYTNMGNAISDLGSLSKDQQAMVQMYSKAIDYYEKSLAIKRELGDKKGMSTCFTNVGCVLAEKAKATKDIAIRVSILDEAIGYYQKSVQIDSALGDHKGLALIYGNMASLYLALADSLIIQSDKLRRERVLTAIAFGKRAFAAASKIKALPEILSSTKYLNRGYAALGDYKSALRYANISLSAKDSLFSNEKYATIAELEARYQTEKKQLEIETLSREQELQKARNDRQRIIIIFSLIGVVLLIVFVLFVNQRLRIASRQNRIIEEQSNHVANVNELLQQQNEEITSQRDEIEAQHDLVVAQKAQIESILKNVNQSIEYAKLIQSSILPTDDLMREQFASFFVLYKPKDKVGGDFYWWAKLQNTIIIAVADCTGHGVPGGFMSMLGSSLLREIVQKEHITHPGVILRKLRKEVVRALKQKDVNDIQRDGLDVALISIDIQNNTLQFAGAQMPLVIARKPINDGSIEDCVTVIKGDKMPVGIYERMDPYVNHEVQLQSGDCLYLFSDGFVDQFGGPNKKRFSSKRLREYLAGIYQMPMDAQREALNYTIEAWRSENGYDSDQTDDITMVGLRIK